MDSYCSPRLAIVSGPSPPAGRAMDISLSAAPVKAKIGVAQAAYQNQSMEENI